MALLGAGSCELAVGTTVTRGRLALDPRGLSRGLFLYTCVRLNFRLIVRLRYAGAFLDKLFDFSPPGIRAGFSLNSF